MHLCGEALSRYSEELQDSPPNMTAQILVIFEIRRVFFSFSLKFKRNLDVKKFRNIEDLNPVIGICEGTLRGLRFLRLNMVAQILVVFEI